MPDRHGIPAQRQPRRPRRASRPAAATANIHPVNGSGTAVIASICVRQALFGSKSGVAFDAPLRKFPPVIPEPWSTPPQLFREFESGRITRAQLHAALAWHARELIMEMVDDRLHPAAAWVEQALARRATARLLRRHSEQRLRAILAALSEVPGFPPARWLWNAPHAEVPLHCLLRIRREPVFRLRAITNHPGSVEVAVEYGSRRAHAATRERFTLEHSHHGTLRVAARQPEPRA